VSESCPPALGHRQDPSCDILRKGKHKPMETRDSMRRDAAESLAVQALSFLAGEPERLARFLALTGLGPDRIRAAAASPGFLAGVLDHVASEDALVTAFAAEAGIAPEEVEKARRVLGSGEWERETRNQRSGIRDQE
jgi:Protein of unknown function (DUF3572)